MRQVFQEAVALSQRGEPFVIATVVRTKGSTPQKPGAKLLVRQDGSAVGTLGGGCVEGDIWFAAREIMRHGAGAEYKDYFLNEEIAARDGLVCGGTMYFLIDPVRDTDAFLPTAKAVTNAYQGEGSVALAMLIKPGSSEDNVGARLLIGEDGVLHGTLGRSDLDRLAVDTAGRLTDYGQCEYVVTADGAELFVEGYTSPATLILVGGGHIARAVAPLAKSLGLRLFVLDDRQEFANKERFPEAEEVVVGSYADGLSQFPVTKNTAVVVVTRGHNFDDVALESAARTQAGYVGLMGSQRKVLLIFEQLLKRGVPMERIRDMHAPIGLDIHARTPEEIAVSIMAEVIQWRLGGTGQAMNLSEKQLQRMHQRVTGEKAPATTLIG